MIYDSQQLLKRTNADFHSKTFPDHHTKLTPNVIETHPIEIIKSFPFDYMHVTCLGVIRTPLSHGIKKEKKFIHYPQ